MKLQFRLEVWGCSAHRELHTAVMACNHHCSNKDRVRRTWAREIRYAFCQVMLSYVYIYTCIYIYKYMCSVIYIYTLKYTHLCAFVLYICVDTYTIYVYIHVTVRHIRLFLTPVQLHIPLEASTGRCFLFSRLLSILFSGAPYTSPMLCCRKY